jgi:hypothetical protein
MAKQSEWPTEREPSATFVTPDGYLNSARSVAGPLRMGTEPRVGPRGAVAGGNSSDFGTDRISPRGFDPMGTALDRYGPQEASERVKRTGR